MSTYLIELLGIKCINKYEAFKTGLGTIKSLINICWYYFFIENIYFKTIFYDLSKAKLFAFLPE